MPEPRIIDLRSDTVTKPTPAMREAMAQAEVGDDAFGEDPTVNRLEARAAELMGKEAAVFVASGTMGNLTSLLAHCQRGDEAIVGSDSHILRAEAGGVPGLGSVQLRPVPNDDHGMLDLDAVEATIRGDNIHFPRTAAVCLEDTHNFRGGGVLTAQEVADVAAIAKEREIAVHLDGARIFNAAIVLGVPASELTKEVDSVSFCLSKGLSAPVGSLVCGSTDFVAQARRVRKMVGGGMRQAGIIAAAGIVALETMIDRLAEDHENAAALANGLARVACVRLDPQRVRTNIVIFEVTDSAAFQRRLRDEGVLSTTPGPGLVRMVTHYDISREDISEALERVHRVVEAAA